MCCGEGEKKPMTFKKYEDRSCTDVLFLLFLIATLVSTIAMVAQAGQDGASVDNIMYGFDYNGVRCGTGVNTGKGLAMWPKIYPIWRGTFIVCVSTCKDAESTNGTVMKVPYMATQFGNYCLPKCVYNGLTWVGGSGCPVSGSIPDINSNAQASSATESAAKAMGDIMTAWPIILACVFIALIISVLFVKLLRCECFVSCMVWGTMLAFLLAGIFTTYFCINYAYTTPGITEDNKNVSVGLGSAVGALTFIFMLMIVFLRNRINLAIEIIVTSATAVDQTGFGMLLFPLFPLITFLIYLGFWMAVALCLYSVKTFNNYTIDNSTAATGYWYGSFASPTDSSVPSSFSSVTTIKESMYTESYQYAFLYHVFVLLYMIQFFSFFTYMVLCGVFSRWYFSKNGENGLKIVGEGDDEFPDSALTASCCMVCRFHLGTVSFADVIIAIIQFIRMIIAYMQEQAKGSENVVLQYLLCCIQCVCGCIESCADYFSKNAVVWSTFTGDNLCESGGAVITVLAENGLRATAMIFVTNFMLFIGKLTITLGTTGLGCLLLNYAYPNQLSSIVMPAFIIAVEAYIISNMYLAMFEVGVDTVFICYLSEGENVMWAPDNLKVVYKKCHDEDASNDAAGGVQVEKQAS